jgi:hypothetical protein
MDFSLSAQLLLIYGSFYQILSRLQANIEPILPEATRKCGTKAIIFKRRPESYYSKRGSSD